MKFSLSSGLPPRLPERKEMSSKIVKNWAKFLEKLNAFFLYLGTPSQDRDRQSCISEISKYDHQPLQAGWEKIPSTPGKNVPEAPLMNIWQFWPIICPDLLEPPDLPDLSDLSDLADLPNPPGPNVFRLTWSCSGSQLGVQSFGEYLALTLNVIFFANYFANCQILAMEWV